jgi:hypothetical protein
LQAAYEQFGCNQGNVFFIGIDKGSTNANVIYFDSVYGVQYPGVSGQQGGGNIVHLAWEIQATPSIIVVTPDRLIAVNQIYPPTYEKVVDSILNEGGLLMECLNAQDELKEEEVFTLLPNPATDATYLRFNQIMKKELEVKVFDAVGILVRKIPLTEYDLGEQWVRIDLDGLLKGLYFIRIDDGKQVIAVKKLVKSY